MPRIFKVPFAAQGDKDVVPEATQGDGSVSITQGFGFDYEREYEDPASKDIRREVMNGLLHDLSEAIGDIQLSGVAKWSKDAAPYPEGALVWHNNQAWLSLVGNNSVTPTLGSSWTSQADPRLFLALANNLSDLPNPATARTNLGLGNSATARTNLGLGDSATRDVGTGSGQVAAGNDSRITGAAQKSANLSDLPNPATARTNLGVPSVSESQGIAAAAVSAHVAQSNPHPQYGVPAGIICMWSGSILSVPSGWALCNGQNGTPDLRDRFVVGAGGGYSVGATGGAAQVTLTTAQIPAHNHSATTATAGGHSHPASTGSAGNHSHSGSASSGGSHSHDHRVNTSGIGSTSGKYLYGSGSWRTNSVPNVTIPGPNVVASDGEHTHSLSIDDAGAHTHSVSVASGGEHTHGVSVGNTGGGGAHENRPPYYALAYIMKV